MTLTQQALNDTLRQTLTGGIIVFSQEVAQLPKSDQFDLLKKLRAFNDFTPDNDPYGEHDFGSFDHNHHTFFWKIDCYDTQRQNASPNPEDPSVTCRVLTLYFAHEH